MSGFYNGIKQALLSRAVPSAATLCAVGVNDTYVFDATDDALADFNADILLPEATLSSVTYTNGILDAADQEWANAGAGISDRSLILTGVILYFKYGSDVWLIAYIDSASAGLPQSLTGVDITAIWDSAGILQL